MSESFLRRTGRRARRLGFRAAAEGAIFSMAQGSGPRAFHLRGHAHPLWARPGTTDMACLDQIFVHREYDFSRWPDHKAALDRAYARKIDADTRPVIIDCGANVGYASIWFARRYPRSVVYAIEPDPDNFAILLRNVASYSNIKPIAAGISDQPGRLSIRPINRQAWASRSIEDAQGEIPAVTIDQLFGYKSLAALLIVKIDIEGHEAALFRSGTEWADLAPLVICETHDWLFAWRGTAQAVFQCLVRTPRDYLMHGERIFAFAHSARSPAG